MSESKSYVDLNTFKANFQQEWKSSYDIMAARLLEVASARLRAEFSSSNRDLDKDIESGAVEKLIVEDVVISMVTRALTQSSSVFGGFEGAEHVQASTGPYSLSVSGGQQSLYVKSEEKKALGLRGLTYTIFLGGSIVHHDEQ